MPGTLRVVIADDDGPFRNMLAEYLKSFFPGVSVVGTAANGEELLKTAGETNPDAVFVDVQMPGVDGLSAVQVLQRKNPGLFVVFISAHVQYAVEAFNLEAADFLAKPVSKERLQKTIDKINRYRDLLEAGSRHARGREDRSPTGITGNQSGLLVLKSGHGITILDKQSIFFIEKQGAKCIFHTTGGNYEISSSLAALEKHLPEQVFFRCHKSYIINIRWVEKIEPYADRAYQVFFRQCPDAVTMRREKLAEFCNLIGRPL